MSLAITMHQQRFGSTRQEMEETQLPFAELRRKQLQEQSTDLIRTSQRSVAQLHQESRFLIRNSMNTPYVLLRAMPAQREQEFLKHSPRTGYQAFLKAITQG